VCEFGSAVFRALINRPVDATMVQSRKSRRVALSPLRAFKYRVTAGTSKLSILFRTSFHAQSAGNFLGLGPGSLRGLRWSVCAKTIALKTGWRGGRINTKRPGQQGRSVRFGSPFHTRDTTHSSLSAFLAAAARVRIGPPARDDK
jgi:hypothetical protein